MDTARPGGSLDRRRAAFGRKSAAVRAASLALLAALAPQMALAQSDDTPSPDDVPHITVVGAASADVAPDTIELRLAVTTDRPSAAEAWAANGATTQAVLDAATAAGVAAADLATTDITLAQRSEPEHQPDGTVRMVPRGFEATHTLRVTTRDIVEAGSLAEALIAKGANRFDGLAFTTAHPDQMQDKLRGEAMRDARHQAEVLAAAAGVKLGKLLQIERPDADAPRGLGTTQEFRTKMAMPVAPGRSTVSVAVEATYAIE